MFKCIKCGGDDIIIRYNNGNDGLGERLMCKCITCEYTFRENTKDNADA